ncbi:hypothetical protein MKY91_10895 [Alkalicoccobacillus gibsonii]|uniref:DUF4352 domain-containing protein n=1 Tax=Alkalicoccobacillus gibsonii TaxID=79881 RepID=A0ABU9VKB2_9BACI
MKKIILSLGLVSVLSLAACGDSNEQEASEPAEIESNNTENTNTETDDAEEEIDTAEENSDNDWETQVGETNEDGTLKLLVRSEDPVGIETGPMTLSFPQITVSEVIEWPEELADYYDIEPTGIIQIDMEVSNTEDEDINFYMDQATITTNTGEQLDPDLLASDHIGGEFLGAVNKSGSIRYMLTNSAPNEVEWVRILIDAPSDNNYESIGDSIDVQIDF